MDVAKIGQGIRNGLEFIAGDEVPNEWEIRQELSSEQDVFVTPHEIDMSVTHERREFAGKILTLQGLRNYIFGRIKGE